MKFNQYTWNLYKQSSDGQKAIKEFEESRFIQRIKEQTKYKITMKKILAILSATLVLGCSSSKKEPVPEPLQDKYTAEQAQKAYMELKWGMALNEMINLGYISVEDTSKWVIPLKYKQIGHEEFEDVSIMTHENKLFAIIFHEYVEGYRKSIHKLDEAKNLFRAQYGNPEFEKDVSKDSLELDVERVLYLWNIRHKRIKGTIEKSSDNMFFVDITIEDTITRHQHDSIAIAYQSKDL